MDALQDQGEAEWEAKRREIEAQLPCLMFAGRVAGMARSPQAKRYKTTVTNAPECPRKAIDPHFWRGCFWSGPRGLDRVVLYDTVYPRLRRKAIEADAAALRLYSQLGSMFEVTPPSHSSRW